jgi:hypothetical protein
MRAITTNVDSGFAVSMTFTNPSVTQTATIAGLHTKHNLSVDTDGTRVNTKNTHISFSEAELNAAGYTTRPAGDTGPVNLYKHKVEVKDSTGVNKTYQVDEAYPDETLGLIVCILGDYAD